MTRRAAQTAQPVDDSCLLCGAPVTPFWHPELQEVVQYDLCPRCAQAFQEVADRVADRTVAELAPPAHDFEALNCGHPKAVGEFPVAGRVCPACKP